jgi:hypothetical protein
MDLTSLATLLSSLIATLAAAYKLTTDIRSNKERDELKTDLEVLSKMSPDSPHYIHLQRAIENRVARLYPHAVDPSTTSTFSNVSLLLLLLWISASLFLSKTIAEELMKYGPGGQYTNALAVMLLASTFMSMLCIVALIIQLGHRKSSFKPNFTMMTLFAIGATVFGFLTVSAMSPKGEFLSSQNIPFVVAAMLCSSASIYSAVQKIVRSLDASS